MESAVGSISDHLGVFGGTGLTAYVGLLDIGQPKAGETVFVSAAAGAVGSAGSDAMVAVLRAEIGFDGAFNYKAETDVSKVKGRGQPSVECGTAEDSLRFSGFLSDKP